MECNRQRSPDGRYRVGALLEGDRYLLDHRLHLGSMFTTVTVVFAVRGCKNVVCAAEVPIFQPLSWAPSGESSEPPYLSFMLTGDAGESHIFRFLFFLTEL